MRYAPDPEKLRYPYLPDSGLQEAVNMAMVLQRPLLLKGPPGCGKTRLAYSVAHELGIPLHPWYVKSTSRARDGLYMIDLVRRLQDAQIRGDDKAQQLHNYVTLGPLGTALRREGGSVVLIDEIDKADLDFPNDLLQPLEEKQFTIDELEANASPDDPTIAYKYDPPQVPPVVIITSNDEKELPDAFLRRCLFYYIDFPDAAQLARIVAVNLQALNIDLDERLVSLAVDRLMAIRNANDYRKKPATSELIDWIRILHHWGVDVSGLETVEHFRDLPYWRVLFKHQLDIQTVQGQ